ncbi:MAG: ankyrin repeat domain-containing protein [Chloroflexi bacterium]|nr:ankyrin repeat domain-containing protein [Chloroflexota bacterium]
MSKELFDAVRQGKLVEVKRLIAADPDLIYTKENGLGPVMVAIYHQHAAIAEFLTEKAGSLNIFEAAAMGRTSQVIRHLARDAALVNAYASDGFQPLGLACFFGHIDTAEYLIKAGAPINSPSKNPLMATPIQSATAAGHAHIVILLLSHRADPNVREQGGFTPLHAAAQNGNVEIIRSLLFSGADLSIRSKNGKNPVDMATEAGHLEAAKLLKSGITRRFRAVKPINKQ